MTTTTIRPAQRADLDSLSAMITALASFHNDTATLDVDLLQRDIFGAQPWVRVLMACQQDKIVGYTALCPLIQLQFCARGLDMHHVFVAPSYRGQGVGRALINGAIQSANALSCQYLMIGTSPENKAAKAAYMACGFVETQQDSNRFVLKLS